MKNRVKELRKSRSWTQQTLGDTLSVSRQTVNAIENQRYDPSLSLAFLISKTFELTIEEVFMVDEPPKRKP